MPEVKRLVVKRIDNKKMFDGVNNNHIILRCPHCNETYEAEIGKNPLVIDGLTITPVPLTPEIEVEGEQ